MFESARIKLTAWYLLIVMLISILFSIVIYSILVRELDRGLRRVYNLYLEAPGYQVVVPRPPSETLITESEERVVINLVYLNLAILVISAVSGYFLAGRTLRPIKTMVDEQNRFITDASHELRTPITAIRTEIEVALRDKKLTLPEAKEILSSNLEEATAIQALSESLLHLARFQNGNKAVVFSRIPIQDIINESVKKVSSLAKAKQIVISQQISKTSVIGDKQNLVELFVVLLDNAIKYSQKKCEIKVQVKNVNGKMIASVEDFGIGIDKNELSNIFNRFYRAEKSRTKTQAGGYGLGLSIAQQIVKEHDGQISVKSELGKGSIFTVELPVAKIT